MLQTDELALENAPEAPPAARHEPGSDRGETASDTLPSRSNSQAGALASVHVSLTAALQLLSKHSNSSCCSNSGRASDQQLLRPVVAQKIPIVARFLESLPSVGRGWSFDAPSTIHSIADVNDDACSDSISCCSCTSYQLQQQQRPQSASAAEAPAASRALQGPGRHAAGTNRNSSCTPLPAAAATTMSLSAPWSAEQFRGACDLIPNGVSPSKSWCCGSAARASARRCLSFPAAAAAEAESTGSAPTPSPIKAAADAADATGHGDAQQLLGSCAAGAAGSRLAAGSRRGVFVGGLPGDVSERTLVELFSRCGRIDKLWIARNASSQASLGYGFVVFDPSSGEQATERAERELNGVALQQQRICVRVSNRNF